MTLFFLLMTAGWTYPSDFEWQDLERAGGALADPAGDGPIGALDLLGDSTEPAASFTVSSSRYSIRLQLSEDPLLDGALYPGVYGVFLDIDDDPTSVEGAFVLDVVGGTISVQTTSVAGVPTSMSDFSQVVSTSVYGVVRRDTDGTSFWIDFELSRSSVEANLAIDPQVPIRFLPFTAETLDGPVADLACDLQDCTVLDAVLADGWFVDADVDGITDPQEVARGSDPEDADSDDDGLLDGDEGLVDSDGGGSYDLNDCDSDNDGLRDGVEFGVTPSTADPDTDPASACFPEDADPQTTTNPKRRDTDGGGMWDGWEDRNLNGSVDGDWETDPNLAEDDLDTDGDYIPDVLEAKAPDGVIEDEDSDGDGISDIEEWLYDWDGDGLPSFIDDDSDGDGISDADETNADADDDDIPNYRDLDSDGDGRSDAEEGDQDLDGDGVPNYLDRNSDGSGSGDSTEGDGDEDCDGVVDWKDPDHDDSFCDDAQDPPGADGVITADPNWSGDAVGPGTVGGGACATGPSAGWLGIWLPLLLLRRRRTGALPSGSAGGTLLVLVIWPNLAWGQTVGLDAQRFSPGMTSETFVRLEEAKPSAPFTLAGGLWMNHADDPLVFRPTDGSDELALLGQATTVDMVASFTFWRWLRLGMDLPLHVNTVGVGVDQGTNVGDARVSVRGTTPDALSGPMDWWTGGVVELSLPTGVPEHWVGSDRARVHLRWVGQATEGPVHLGWNLGLRTGSGQEVADVTVVPAVTGGVGAGVDVACQDGESTRPCLTLLGELEGQTPMGAGGGSPLEALGSARLRLGRSLRLTAGAGTGLTRGLGSPDFRVVGGITWATTDDGAG